MLYCKELLGAYSDYPEEGLLGHSAGIFTIVVVKQTLLIL